MADTPLGLDSVVVRSEEPVHSEVDGEVVMMSVEQGSYYGLDPVGSRIWELIDTPRSIASICDALQGEFRVDRATCEHEVSDFLEKMNEERLIRVVS